MKYDEVINWNGPHFKKRHLFVWIKIGVHALQKLFFALFSHYRKSSQYSIAVAFLGIRKYKLGISCKFLKVFVYLDFGLLRLEFQNSMSSKQNKDSVILKTFGSIKR